MKRLSTRKKILIASLLVGVLVVGALVSLVIVLAAQTQGVSSTINVTYVVEDVGAKVSARYAVVTTSTGEVSGDWVNLVNGSETEHEFEVGHNGDGVVLNPTETEVKLSSADSTIVYEYKFTNTTESAFTIQLTNQPDVANPDEVNNMSVAYKSSAVEMSTFTSTTVADSTLKTQFVVEENATTYLYVKANVADLNKGAYYTGNIEWTLTHVSDNDDRLEEATLNNNGGTGGATTVKFLANADGKEYQLPHLTTLPTASDTTKMFNGYKNGEVYVYDANGTSNSAVTPTNADTYVAEWVDKPFIVSETGELLDLSDEMKAVQTLNIPEDVKIINTGVLSGTNAAATTINIPNSVTTIGASAFEGNTNVQNIIIEEAEGASAMAYASGNKLTTIGASAFKNCTNLKHLVIPSNVTSVTCGKTGAILVGCNKLEIFEISADVLITPPADVMTISALCTLFGGYTEYNEGYGGYIGYGEDVPTTLTTIIFNGGNAISDRALYGCNIENIIIGESITRVGQMALGDSLTSVVFENINGWSCNGATIDVTNPETNAINFIGDWYLRIVERIENES